MRCILERMKAHEYYGDGDHCFICDRVPGNHLHIGLDDEDVNNWPAREVRRMPTYETDTPAVLRG